MIALSDGYVRAWPVKHWMRPRASLGEEELIVGLLVMYGVWLLVRSLGDGNGER